MYCAILIAAIHLLSPPVINAEKGNEDDNWVDPFYMDSKIDTVANEWSDPFDLEGHRDLEETVMKFSTENDIKELPKTTENDELVAGVKSSEKNMQINEEMEVSTKLLGKMEGENTETENKENFGENLEKGGMCYCENNEMEHNFLQRFINMLVNICVSKNNEMQQKISVTLEISPEELKQLQTLKDKKDIAPAIRLLNTIISDMKFNNHGEDNYSSLIWFIRLISSKEVWMEIGVISFAILPSCLFILGGRIAKIICITLLMTFSVSYYGTYRFLRLKVKEKNERILSSTLTCTPDERSWYHTVFGSNSDSECQKRWDALHIDPSVEVTPVKIISHMIGVFFFQPLEQFGVMFSSFSSQIFESQPLLRGMIVYATAVMIIMAVIFFCCYGIRDRNRSLGSHNYPYGFASRPPFEPAGSSFHSNSRNQTYNPRTRNQVPGSSYEALSHQPVYIITNYTDHIPKNPVTRNVKAKPQVLGKKGNSSSKKKSGKFSKKDPNSSYLSNDGTKTNYVPSDGAETTDDETEPMAPKHGICKRTKSVS